MKKTLILSAIILLAASCNQNQTTAVIPAPSPAVTTSPSPTATPITDPSKIIYVEWTFKQLPNGKYDEPYSQIGLKLSGAVNKSVDLGKFSGCRINDGNTTPTPEQITELYCWWAGAGDDLTVMWNKEDEITIFHQEIGETPDGIQPDPKLLKTLTIPRGLAVENKSDEQ